MTTLEKIEAQIKKIDSILLLDYITGAVREELTNIKTSLESVKAELS
tara:strand:+ start:1723 stop:1863 length:141 start_codon:yes stop_codon:yes gene_type:complete